MGFFWVILALIIISTVIGAVSKMFANLNEMNAAARQRPPAPRAGGGTVRQANSDMDRFLAEIDRLRKKSAEAPPPAQNQPATVPVVQPAKQPDRPRTRVVAELAEPVQRPVPTSSPLQIFSAPQAPPAPPSPLGPQPGELPSVVTLPAGTGAPATRVTRIAGRARPAAKTPFAKTLTAILTSGQGPAMAVVLQEVLGPPKSRKRD